MDREDLRLTFDGRAALYDRVRPGYPPEMVDDLIRLAGIAPAASVLEIGCGTGQLSVALATRGLRLLAVELGPNLAALARANLARFPAAEVVNADFERWPPPREPFDLVVAATAFHWLDPDTRVARAASLLRPGGALAVIDTHHVRGGDVDFFAEAQACYRRWDPETPPNFRHPTAAEVPSARPELDGAAELGPVELRRYEWTQSYTAAGYADVLRTYSGHIKLPPPALRGLLDCLTALIGGRYGGRITKAYLTELRVARTRA